MRSRVVVVLVIQRIATRTSVCTSYCCCVYQVCHRIFTSDFIQLDFATSDCVRRSIIFSDRKSINLKLGIDSCKNSAAGCPLPCWRRRTKQSTLENGARSFLHSNPPHPAPPTINTKYYISTPPYDMRTRARLITAAL